MANYTGIKMQTNFDEHTDITSSYEFRRFDYTGLTGVSLLIRPISVTQGQLYPPEKPAKPLAAPAMQAPNGRLWPVWTKNS